jgi:radical SAM protein with 4Fe4S-binding SPASM domain
LKCDPQEDGAYGRFANRARARAFIDRVPVGGTVELTASCNLECTHCYIPASIPGYRDLATEQWFDIFDQLAAHGCLWLGLTGGEPLSRADFPLLYERAKRLGFLVTVMTNGTLLGEETAELFASLPPLMVEISVYGAGRRTYGETTGAPDGFDAAMRAIEALAAREIRFLLKMTVTRRNVRDHAAVADLARRFGVPFRFDGLLSSRLDGDRAPVDERVRAEALVALEMGDPRARRAWDVVRDHQERHRHDDDLLFACGAGRSTFHVDFRGRLSPCIMVREPAYPLTEGPFRRGWDTTVMATVSRAAAPGSTCAGCSLMPACSTCAGWGCMEHADPEAVESYLCDVAGLREQVLRSRRTSDLLEEATDGRR